MVDQSIDQTKTEKTVQLHIRTSLIGLINYTPQTLSCTDMIGFCMKERVNIHDEPTTKEALNCLAGASKKIPYRYFPELTSRLSNVIL